MVDEQNSTVTNETDTGSVEPGQRAQLVVVANRLPFDLEVQPDGGTLAKPSPGGLVTALEPILARRRGAWIGWPGTPDVELQPTAADGLTLYPVTLSRDEVDEYYEGFSNATLWPLYHDAVADSEFHREWWEAYRRVNARFAERAAQVAAPGATVWVHDYQLQLVPQLLRALRPDVRIGFFLHIPFPPAELYQRLPWRAPLLAGMLGADLIGFQLSGGTRNFLRLARTLLGAPTTSRTVTHEGRTVRVGAFPISIDSRALAELAGTEQVQRTAREHRAELGNPRRMILGVDRLDYTKGIDVRLQAFGELLAERDPAVADAVMVQIATPSRERLASYVATRENIERQVGALNGDFGRIGRPAVHYLHQSLPRQDLTAFYVAADVMTVTPLRDGMNLVAKEYVACRVRGDGVLLLSEFTGAARELRAALQVNPYDTDGVKEALRTALTMPSAQAGRRMRSLRRQVLTHHVDRWASLFLSALEGGDQLPVGVLRPEQVKLIETLAAAPRLLVATDFDGTMAPLVDDPAAATAAPGSVEALRSLASTPNTVVAVVSGRSLNDLRELLGDTDGLHLIGSHGIEIDRSINSPTELLSAQQAQLLSRLQDRAAQIVDEEPGTRLEPKPFGVAVHVRGMDPVAAQAVVDRLRNGPARWQGVHLMHGKMVVELTVLRADKGTAISRLAELNGCTTTVFLGDDVTDERAFAVLGLEDAGIKVGPGPSSAGHRLADPAQVGQWLSRLAEARSRLLEGVSAS